MAPRREGKRQREDESDEEEEEMGRPVVFLSSSSGDDEEANLDLSLEIVERARKKREEERNNDKRSSYLDPLGRVGASTAVIELSSSEEGEAVSARRNRGGIGEAPPAATAGLEGSKRKKKRKKKQKKEADEEGSLREDSETADEAVLKNEEESMGIAASVAAETNGAISDNIVLRKLLRGPRYFDPGSSQWESCYNCGKEGHVAADCTAEKRKRPCFVCGMFGHNANKCSQGQDCFVCKRRGHFAKDCPDKHTRISQDTQICLRCGDLGHDMSSCGNAYPLDDLKKIQCYVCKGFGHFCCVDFIDTASREISCYNCGDSGHTGIGCAKPRGELSSGASPTLCYVCGEEGHFARGCTKKSKFHRKRKSEWSTPTPKPFKNKSTPRYPKHRKDSWGSKSLPQDFGRVSKSASHSKFYKKGSMQSEGRREKTTGKSWIKGGWMVDDPADLPKRDQELRPWKTPRNKSWKSPSTPRTPVQKSYNNYNSAGSSHWNRV